MSDQRDERRLDEALQEAINTSRPAFDAEAWKQKYAAAYQTLVSRGEGTAARETGGGRTVRFAVRRLAVAAVLVLGVTLLVTQMREREAPGPVAPAEGTAGPAGVVSMMSLRIAYQQGGQEGLSAQLDKALKHLGPRPNGLSMRELFEDLDG